MNRKAGEHKAEEHPWAAGDAAVIDLGEISAVVRRHIRVLVGCLLLGTSLAVVASFHLTPLYTATSQVLIDPRERHVVDQKSVLAGLSADEPTIENQLEVLRSRLLAESVVEELELYRDPEFNPRLREPDLQSRVSAWLGVSDPNDAPSLPPDLRRERELADVVDEFWAALEVDRLGVYSFVLAISITSLDPDKAALIANTLAELYLTDQLEAKFQATRRATEWLEKRLAALREQVRDSERVVETYRAEHGLLDSRGATVNEQQLSELNGQLILARADLAEKRARFRRVSELVRSGASVDSIAEVLASSVVTQLRRQQAELGRKQAELTARYGERHPQMIKVRAEQHDLGGELEAEVNRIVANLGNEVAVARSRTRALEEGLADLEREASEGEQARVQLRELQREASANRTLYESFLGRFKETSEQEEIQEADARIISRATAPKAPSYPSKRLAAGFGFVASTLLGLGAIFVLERLRDGYRATSRLEAELQLPHLASVPELVAADAMVGEVRLPPQDYILERPLSAYGESVRALRTTLLFSNGAAPPKVILFTSALPSEGKTTLSVSMARAAAQSGLRTLLIDADLRYPSVAKILGAEPQAGLAEVLEGKARLEDVLHLDEASGMRFMPALALTGGAGRADPSNLLGSRAMSDLLEELRKHFELILLDSSPVLAVSESRVVSQICDRVVLIVQWEKTPREAAKIAVNTLRQFDTELAGVVLSRFDLRRAPHYFEKYATYYVS
jgi:exopolysaccharide transport family protein